MQNPVGAEFNLRNHAHGNFPALHVFNRPPKLNYVHTVPQVTPLPLFLCWATLLHAERPRCGLCATPYPSPQVWLAAILSVIVLGDEAAIPMARCKKTKLAAIEANGITVAPPAAFTSSGILTRNHGSIMPVKIPGYWV